MALIFAVRDVIHFDRLVRGIIGISFSVVSVGFLIAGYRRFSTIALFAHYVGVKFQTLIV